MKKLLFILSLSLFWANAAFAQWMVQTVPNTRMQGNEIHVSDPNGYLSDSTESVINTALCAICDQADVFVVTTASGMWSRNTLPRWRLFRKMVIQTISFHNINTNLKN